MNITEISKLRNKFEDFMAVYTKKSAEIILYGAGNGARYLCTFPVRGELACRECSDH